MTVSGFRCKGRASINVPRCPRTRQAACLASAEQAVSSSSMPKR